ncbi:MAG: lysoplasmalogenase [Clostridia bacterium]|nr:lysoplasmalogenase [Clostridia bacterium]
MWTPIILAIVLALWFPFYVYTEYRWEKSRFLFTKIVASLLFIAIAVTAFLILKPRSDYAVWIIAALALGMIGDGLLVFFGNLKYFILGLAAFLIGQIIYGVTFLRFVGFMWIDVAIYVVLVAAALFAYTKVNLKLGKMKIPVLAYVLIIAFMFVMAISSLYKCGFNNLTSAMIAVGAVLFLASDVVLAFVVFHAKPHRALRAINLSLYYSAQMVLALTLVTIGG